MITYGNHNPFDSDACLEWGIFCINNNHDPDTPITFDEEDKGNILLQNINLITRPLTPYH